MMLRLGVTLVTLAVIFGLMALALGAAQLLANPYRVATVLLAALALGIILLLLD